MSASPAFEPRNPAWEADLRASFARQGVMAHIGAELGALAPGRVEIRLPYGAHVSQQHGFFHGGIIATIADSAGGYGGFSLMGPGDGVLTVEFKLNLMAPADGDLLIARGRVLRPGRSLFVTSAEVAVVKDGAETPCAVMQQTLMRITGRHDVTG